VTAIPGLHSQSWDLGLKNTRNPRILSLRLRLQIGHYFGIILNRLSSDCDGQNMNYSAQQGVRP